MMTGEEAMRRFVELGNALLVDGGSRTSASEAELLARFRKRVALRPHAFRKEVEDDLERRRAALSDLHARQLRVLGDGPDLFSPLGHVRLETLHTRVIAWALSPSRLSVLKTAPLRALLASLAERHPGVDPEWANAAGEVEGQAEFDLGGLGRVDVWVELPAALIAIEAKIGHFETDGQTVRYRKAVQREKKRRAGFVVYLAPAVTPPPSDRKALVLTFRDLLRAWLPVAAAGDSGEHRYLGMYLCTVANHLLNLAAEGRYETWPVSRRARTLAFLEERSDDPDARQ